MLTSLKTIIVKRIIIELLMQNRSSSNQERNFSYAASADHQNKYLSKTFEASIINSFSKNLFIFKGLAIRDKVKRMVEIFQYY